MSLITRCPACETLFKVVPDQLRVSDGWVRCGRCDEIFDASLHLVHAVQRADPPIATEPPEHLATELVHTEAAEVGLDSQPIEPVFDSIDHAEAPSPEPELLIDAPVGSESDELPLDGEVSFLGQPSGNSLWQRPLWRATLALASFGLLLGLGGQIVVHERDRIAAHAPDLKPWLLAFCGPMQCTLSPLQRIDSIVIDSASFVKIRGDSYRLSFTVKNMADIALAAPAVELTLTDLRDQAVVRRVFLPAEIGIGPGTLAAGAEWPASLAIAVKATGAVDRFAGYRLLAFYP